MKEMDELFAPEEVTVKSPRLEWIARHSIEVTPPLPESERIEDGLGDYDDQCMWHAFAKDEHYHAKGWTEDQALLTIARKMGITFYK